MKFIHHEEHEGHEDKVKKQIPSLKFLFCGPFVLFVSFVVSIPLLHFLGGTTNAAAAEQPKSKAPSAASGELAVYTAWDERDINALIAGFNKVYPNVRVSG